MSVKTYPFSAAKHAHDIEFFRNRMLNIMDDMICGEIPMNREWYDATEKLMDSDLFRSMFDKVIGACCRPVIYLTGPEIGLAKKIMGWASETRAATCVKNGRYDLLKYC